MNEDKKITPADIPEEKLEEVSGGIIYPPSIPYDVITYNHSKYSSGDAPKYRVGQRLKIVCQTASENLKISCLVLEVSSTANCGAFYKEFGYKIQITEAVNGYFLGEIYTGVYESCLYEN